MKRAKRATGPTDSQLLEFFIQMQQWPFKSYMGGPDPISGKTCRDEGSEWYFSFTAEDNSGIHGCVYAPTAREAIAKAMRLRAAQKKADGLLRQAVA